jgi:hypothetical protein
MSAYTFAGMFEWQNTQGGTDVDIELFGSGFESTHLVAGREFFNSAEHITVGPIAGRPSSCSSGVPRSVYVSTDENAQGATLYVCTATNIWTKHWEPFMYPHPITAGSTIPPQPPTNLQILP